MRINGSAAIGFFVLTLILAPLAISEELKILAWEGYAPQPEVDRFITMIQKKYAVDLKVEVKNVSSVEDFFEAIKKRTADIISPAHNLPKDPRFKLIEGKLTIPVSLENIPNYKDILPALQNASYITDGGEVYGVPLTFGPYGLAYNTNIVKEEPQSWNILWKPEYAGKYTISSDYYEANIYTTALAIGLNKNKLADYDTMNTPELADRLKYLAKNPKSMWVGVDTADILSGLALATSWGFALPELQKRGEPWKMATPKEGTTGWVDNWMLGNSLRSNPNLKKIAEEWLNFTLSPEFQVNVVVRAIGCFPVISKLKDRLMPEEIKTYHVDDPNYFKDQFILWDVLDPRTRKGFQLLWEKAISNQP